MLMMTRRGGVFHLLLHIVELLYVWCRREKFDRRKYATQEILGLSPLPCWKHLSEEVRRQLVGEMIADIEAEAALCRQRSGSQMMGASKVRGQHPSIVRRGRKSRRRRCSTRRAS
jgi:hypothetical protein